MSGAIPAGQLRHRLTLKIPVTTIEGFGAQTRAFPRGQLVWAHIRTLRLSSQYGADRQEGFVTHHITLRAIGSLVSGSRFELGTRVFEVLSFEACEGVPLFIRAYCQEIQP